MAPKNESKALLKEVPLTEFFMERVQKAFAQREIAAGQMTEFYLVNLLQEFQKSEKLFEKQGSKMLEKPLALLLREALEGDPHTKIRCLKKMGDLSLYMAGAFAERIKKTLVDLDYYIHMGGGAYSSLSDILNRQKTFAELYAELAKLFPNLVDVVAEVTTERQSKTNKDLLKLYERWLDTGSQYLEELLNKEGIQTQDRTLLTKIQ